ncbi:MAG: alkaline shock response membrane anchor protein AmaP [Clostridia bacterium]|nr:alkaline shock response membrane anchor protein AmaP [Clostridia bacterium]
MKVKVADRILAVVLALFVIALLAVFAAVMLDIVSFNELADSLLRPMPNMAVAKIVYGAVGIIVLLLAIRVIIGMAGTKVYESAPASIHLQTCELGSTYVSLSAIDAMAQRHCRSVSRVRECITNVVPINGGVRIAAKLVLANDANIPELTASLQKSLKEYIESLAGVKVLDVSILIISTPSSQKTQA